MSDYTIKFIKATTDGKILAEVLREGNNDTVSGYAAENPNCPPEVLAEVLRRGKDDYVSVYAVQNPHCPSEALAEVVRRGKDDAVSWNATNNPIYQKYLEKIKRDKKKLKLKEEKFNSNIRSNVNSLFYGIQVNDDR